MYSCTFTLSKRVLNASVHYRDQKTPESLREQIQFGPYHSNLLLKAHVARLIISKPRS